MANETYEPDFVVDSRDSACPGPLMDLIARVKAAESGKVIELKTTDKSSRNDVPDWLDKAGHELLEVIEREDYWSLMVMKS